MQATVTPQTRASQLCLLSTHATYLSLSLTVLTRTVLLFLSVMAAYAHCTYFCITLTLSLRASQLRAFIYTCNVFVSFTDSYTCRTSVPCVMAAYAHCTYSCFTLRPIPWRQIPAWLPRRLKRLQKRAERKRVEHTCVVLILLPLHGVLERTYVVGAHRLAGQARHDFRRARGPLRQQLPATHLLHRVEVHREKELPANDIKGWKERKESNKRRGWEFGGWVPDK